MPAFECTRRDRPPIVGYLAIALAWGAAVLALGLADRVGLLGPLDAVLLALAAHQLSRVIAKERIAFPLRRLFTEADGETPREGWARAPGEMATCPYCASVWSATFLLAADVWPLTVVLALAGAASIGHAWRDRE